MMGSKHSSLWGPTKMEHKSRERFLLNISVTLFSPMFKARRCGVKRLLGLCLLTSEGLSPFMFKISPWPGLGSHAKRIDLKIEQGVVEEAFKAILLDGGLSSS